HAHAHQVAAVDALEALRDDGPHAQEEGTLGGPVPGTARAVLLAGDDHHRDAGLLVLHGRLVDRHLLAGGQVAGPAALLARHQLVAEPDVGKGAPHHDLVVAPAGPVGVEIPGRNAPLLQVAARRA